MPEDYSPDAIRHCYDLVQGGIRRNRKIYKIREAKLEGIIGDEEHYATGGYHVPRHACSATDYSVIHPADRKGDRFAASALDIAFPSGPDSLMTTVAHRLRAAMHNRDPRVRGLVEFGGTLDGFNTFAFYRYSHTSEVGTWSNDHLTHIHISGKRENVNNVKVWTRAAEVVLGIPMTRRQRVWAAAARKRNGVKKI